MNDTKAVIVDYVRTPFTKAAPPSWGKAPGKLAAVNPVDMQVPLINALLERTGIDPKHVRKVLTGCVHQEGSQGANIARMNMLHGKCNLPHSVTGTTLDMFCASSMEAITFADALSARNPEDVYIVTGVQSMSQVEMGGFNPMFSEDVLNSNPANFLSMGNTAENLVDIYDITREEQDAFAVSSHKKMAEAQGRGHFDSEIVPVNGISQDDGVRADSTVEGAGRLKGAFKNGGSITAANSSQVTDGASAVMVTSGAFAKENNLPVKAVILSTGETGLAPMVMGLGPVEASNEALRKANLTMDDIDAIEVNEAFAAQVLACVKEWDKQGVRIDMDKVNVDGGAIAIGHPFGATGARMIGHLSETLNRENKRYGLATLCIGGGQGKAVVIENPNYRGPSL